LGSHREYRSRNGRGQKSTGNFRDNLATTVPDMPQRCKASIETCTAQATLTVVLASRRDLSVITVEVAVRQTICKSLQPAKSFGRANRRSCDRCGERSEARRTLREPLSDERFRDPDSASCQLDAGDSYHQLTMNPFEDKTRNGAVRFDETRRRASSVVPGELRRRD
jgi:hypothetical protein